LVDFIVSADAFPGINLNGGVCYFLWNRDNPGACTVTTVESGNKNRFTAERELNEFDLFIRRSQVLSIVKTVAEKKDSSFANRVSSRKPFGLPTNFHGSDAKSKEKNILLHGSGRKTWISRNQVGANPDWIDKWKVLIPAASDGNEVYPLPIWDSAGPIVSGPGEACTETYLVAGIAESELEARNISKYMRTKFFRFLVWARKTAQHNKAELFRFVPDLDFGRVWTDTDLYSTYGLNQTDCEFIETMIRTTESEDA
jgi:site-specific DNA-methyltransferase (adenine-specific)